jgi:hypothetical protein
MEFKKREVEDILFLFQKEGSVEIFLGGTYLLNKMKLLDRPANDIDLFFYCSDIDATMKKVMENYTKTVTSNSQLYKAYKYGFRTLYANINDKDNSPKLNLVFKPLSLKTFKNPELKYFTMNTVPLDLLLKAKRSYGRWKDIKDFSSMIWKLINIKRIVKAKEHKEF